MSIVAYGPAIFGPVIFGIVTAYGSAIFDAIERGDAARLRRLLAQAKKLYEAQGDLPKAIRAAERALKKLGKAN
jgi:hypothetical protein